MALLLTHLRATACFALTAAGCAMCAPSGGGSPGALDAATEAGEGGAVVRKDSGTPDVEGASTEGAAQDGPAVPDAGAFATGQWVSIAGTGCDQRYAVDPNASVGALAWQPCPSGRQGCTALVVDWPGDPVKPIVFDRRDIVQAIGGQAVILYGRVYGTAGTPGSSYIAVAQALSGARLFATGGAQDPQNACATRTAIGARGIAAQIANTAGGYTFMAAPWSLPPTIQSFQLPASPFGTGGGFSQRLAVGAGPAFLEVRSPNTIYTLDLATKALAAPSPAVSAEAPVAVSDGALAIDLGTASGFDLFRADGSWTHLGTPASPHVLTALAVDRASSQQIVWVESDYDSASLTYVNSIVWMSPYATSAAGLAAKQVAKFSDVLGRGGTWGLVANAGVVLNLVDQSSALLTRVSDGQGWTIAAEAGQGFIKPVWVDDNEVWLATAPTNVNSWSTWSTGIMRIQRSSLGAASVPAGL
jgi:hypothetical protein